MTADQPQRPESREPTTVAGDNLLTDIIQDHEGPSYHVIERIRWGILAIEAEARAAEPATRLQTAAWRLREALLTHGVHAPYCLAMEEQAAKGECDCGLRAVLVSTRFVAEAEIGYSLSEEGDS